MSQFPTGEATAVRVEAWAQIEDPDMTVDEAVEVLRSLGNVIVEVDRPGRRIKVCDVTEAL